MNTEICSFNLRTLVTALSYCHPRSQLSVCRCNSTNKLGTTWMTIWERTMNRERSEWRWKSEVEGRGAGAARFKEYSMYMQLGYPSALPASQTEFSSKQSAGTLFPWKLSLSSLRIRESGIWNGRANLGQFVCVDLLPWHWLTYGWMLFIDCNPILLGLAHGLQLNSIANIYFTSSGIATSEHYTSNNHLDWITYLIVSLRLAIQIWYDMNL